MSFPKKSIYLAGPITGQSYNNARHGWRKTFVDILKARDATHIHCFSPMREKEFLEKDQCIGGDADYESLHGFGTPQGILTRDHNDVRNCDVMIGCFLGAERVSIGTCVEFGFAHSYRKPLIMVMETAKQAMLKIEKNETIDDTIVSRGPSAVDDELRKRGYTDHAEIVRQIAQPHSFSYLLKVNDLRPDVGNVKKNPHDHVFLRACAGYVVPTLEHAADIAQSLLTPGL
jgi:nucleoside 2-deoxyribosyltransferase